MSTGDPAGGQDPWRKEQERTGWYGWIAFAGIMLIVLGLFHGLMGLLAIFEEDYYAVGDKRPDDLRRLQRLGMGAPHPRRRHGASRGSH